MYLTATTVREQTRVPQYVLNFLNPIEALHSPHITIRVCVPAQEVPTIVPEGTRMARELESWSLLALKKFQKGLYRGFKGIMEKKMETTIMGFGFWVI